MRYPASEKLEIIRLVEQSHLPARRTLEKLGVSRASFYRWCDLYQTGGLEALEDKSPRPSRVWNRIPDKVRGEIVQLALDEPELSPRELAARFIDTKSYFVSEASVYRLLKAHDLITSPAFIVVKAADEFKDKTTAPNQLWQTDFTYLKVIGWGWFYLSTILDDFSRYIVAWKLCTTMKAGGCHRDAESGAASVRARSGPRRPSAATAVGQWSVLHLGRSGGMARTSATSSMCAARLVIRKHRARSSAGIRRSRTASCWRTIIFQATWKRTSPPSSSTIIIAAITRAWAISRPPTSTSDAAKKSCVHEKGSNVLTIQNRRLQHQMTAA